MPRSTDSALQLFIPPRGGRRVEEGDAEEEGEGEGDGGEEAGELVGGGCNIYSCTEAEIREIGCFVSSVRKSVNWIQLFAVAADRIHRSSPNTPNVQLEEHKN